MIKIGRNDPCHCGSGQKYKKCCESTDDAARTAELAAQNAARAEAAAEAEESGAGAAGGAAHLAKGGSRALSVTQPKPKGPPRPGPTLMRRKAV